MMSETAPPGRNMFEGKKGVVQIASYDYLTGVTTEEYFERCKRYKQLTPEKQKLILRMKELRDQGVAHLPEYREEMCHAMHLTFSLRNYDIFKKSLSVRNAVEIYPGLTMFSELKREFERVTKKDVDAFLRHLNCVLKDYAREQIKQKCYMCTNKYCSQAWGIIRESETNGVSTPRKCAARIMIYACAQSQRKWADVVYKVYETEPEGWINTNRPHPTVVVHGSPFEEGCAELYCEDTRILTNVNFYEAVVSCYFLYYIFNINYPTLDEETYAPWDNILNLMEELHD